MQFSVMAAREESVGMLFVTLGSRNVVVVVDIENKSDTRERFILHALLYIFPSTDAIQ